MANTFRSVEESFRSLPTTNGRSRAATHYSAKFTERRAAFFSP